MVESGVKHHKPKPKPLKRCSIHMESSKIGQEKVDISLQATA